MKLKCLAVAFVIALFGGVSHADSIYQVTGDLTVTGPTVGSLANACTPSPCVETLNFSFELGYQLRSFSSGTMGYAPYIVPGTMNLTSVGPLDQFAGFSGFLGNEGYNFISFVNDGSDNIDLIEIGGTGLGGFPPDALLPGPPVFPYSLLFECHSAACLQDFGLRQDGTAEATVVPVPEGSQRAMLGICALGILFAMRKYRLA